LRQLGWRDKEKGNGKKTFKKINYITNCTICTEDQKKRKKVVKSCQKCCQKVAKKLPKSGVKIPKL
jgi:hypothetical protein